LQVQPSIDAKGDSKVSEDEAWANLQRDMPSGADIMAFFLAVAQAAPADCGGDCGKPKVTSTSGPTGYSGSATKDKQGDTTWQFTWTFAVNVTIVCEHAAKKISVGRPELVVVEEK